VSDHPTGSFLPLTHDDGSHCSSELFWYGHVKADELDWTEPAEHQWPAGYVPWGWHDADLEVLGRLLRDSYSPEPQHVYGRWVPAPPQMSYERTLDWQRESGRGAFPVTRLIRMDLVRSRRMRRRARRAFRRWARNIHPEAEVSWVYWYTEADEWRARARLPGLAEPATLSFVDRSISVTRGVLKVWRNRYGRAA